MSEKTWNNALRNFIWSTLIKLAKKKKNCYYSDIVCNIYERFGVSLPNEIGYLLGPIMYYCQKNKLPPLTSLIVNKKYGIPGDGLTTCVIPNKEQLKKVYKRVFAYEWEKIQNPFARYNFKNSLSKMIDQKRR